MIGDEIQYEILLNKRDIEEHRLSNILNELSRCFLIYRGEYQQDPDRIIISGEYNMKLFNLLKNALSYKFSVECCNSNENYIEFSSDKNPEKVVSKKINDSYNPGFNDGLVPYEGISAVYNTLSSRASMGFSFTMDRNEETKMRFPIKIL